MIPYTLLLLGLLCVFFEFFVPGGILGAIGGLSILSGVLYQTLYGGSIWEACFFAVLSIAGVFFVASFALKRIKNSKKSSTIYLDKDQEGYKASSYPKEHVGKEAVTASRCVPSGYIYLEDKRYPALSQSGFIDKEEKVIITGGQGAHLLITKKK